MESLCKILCEQNFDPNFTNTNTHYRVILGGRRTIKLFSDWIYKDKELYLQRKYEVFQQETLNLEQLQDRKLKRTKTAVTKRKEDFLNKYQQYNSIENCCESIGIQKATFHSWLKKDVDFKKQFEHLTEILNKIQ
ncbi:hypothetical protein SAMN04488168_10677 [Bacillus sp. 491mf]|nr:hypothetical protein SAMN04488168_10677 [Bacillus sp. 491mf]